MNKKRRRTYINKILSIAYLEVFQYCMLAHYIEMNHILYAHNLISRVYGLFHCGRAQATKQWTKPCSLRCSLAAQQPTGLKCLLIKNFLVGHIGLYHMIVAILVSYETPYNMWFVPRLSRGKGRSQENVWGQVL